MNNEQSARTHFRACNLCEAICGLKIEVDESNRITDIRGDHDDPFSRGYVCPKAVALKDIYADENRLKQPQKRIGDRWQTVDWATAFDETAWRIREIQSKYGRNSVAVYAGNPSVHNVGTVLSRPLFVRALQTKNNFSATSVDQLPAHFAAAQMFGHPLLIPIPDVDRTDLMLIIGANPAASNGSLMTAPGVARRLRGVQTRGGKVVVIDPRRTETAKIADQHFFINPATDVYFLLSLVREVLQFEKSLPDWIESAQVEQLRGLTQNYSPAQTEKLTGINAAAVRDLARALVESKTAVVYGRMGVSVQQFGNLCTWLIYALNIVTGNFDRAGGAMFPSPAIDLLADAKAGKSVYNRWQTAVRGLPEFQGELPVAALAEEIEAGNIKALITICGNPVLSTPNGKALEKSFAKLEFMAAIDIYQNETTANADFILPTTTGLETWHYDLVFHHLAVRNTAKLTLPLFEKSIEQRHDYEIFRELAARLLDDEAAREKTLRFEPIEKIAQGLQFGRYDLTLRQLQENPHGVDLGAMQPVLPARLLTENQRVNLVPELLRQDLERVNGLQVSSSKFQVEDSFDLLLINRRHLRSNNSWMHNSERLMKGANRCTILINPETAAAKNLSDKQTARVVSSVGAIELPIEITHDIAPGVVSIPHGFGHTRPNVKLDTATQFAGASVNDLTDAARLDPLTGNAALFALPVNIIGL